MTDFLIACIAGFATGIISAFGIGGGTLLLLIMTLFLNIETPIARCINLLYFLPTALGSLYYHKKNGYLCKDVITAAVPIGMVCAIIGAVIAVLIDTALLRKVFGLYLLWAGISTLWPSSKKKKPSEGKR